jgi:hypothetical protein
MSCNVDTLSGNHAQHFVDSVISAVESYEKDKTRNVNELPLH